MNKATISAIAALLIISGTLFAAPTAKTGDLLAAFDRSEAKVLELLAADPQLIKADMGDGMTVLHTAVNRGYEAVVDYALKNGLDLRVKDRRGLTPVWFAVSGRQPVLLRKLIALGADLSVTNAAGDDLLFRAAQAGNVEVVRILIASGFKADEQNRRKMSPVHYALYAGHADVIRLLVENGAVIDKSMPGDLTPLHIACLTGSATIHYLLDHGFEVDPRNPRGMTPLRFAVEAGNQDGIRALAMRGADVNASDETGETPFLSAVKKGFAESVALFLNKGAMLNAAEARTGRTPLQEAALRGHSGVVKALLASPGLDKNSKDKDGRTALSYAQKHGNRSAADVLRESGVEDVPWQLNLDDSLELKKALRTGEATIWYLKNSGFAVKTRSALLIFDYLDDDPAPDEMLLANGHVRPEALKDLPVFVFVSHEHPDHFDPKILEWRKVVPTINYVFGFPPPNKDGIVLMGPREQRTLGPLAITTIKANDAGVGFAVQVDGLTIFHAGDHACFKMEMKDNNFFPEIDFLAAKGIRPDISFFINYFGCGVSGSASPEAFEKGIFYAVDKLGTKSCLPIHAGEKEWAYQDLVERVAKNKVTLQVGAAANSGDRFFFSKGKLTS